MLPESRVPHLLLAISLAVTTALPPLGAQAHKPGTSPAKPTLQQAVVVEVYEHDLGKAMKLYQAIADDTATAPDTRAQAMLRLAKVYRRLGERAQADAAFRRAAAGTGAAAQEAKAILSGAVQDDGDLVAAKVEQVLLAMRLTGKPNTAELQWIGAAAVPHVIRAIEAEKADLRFLSNASGAAMALGGKDVVAWLERTRQSEDVLRKRAVIKGYWVESAEVGAALAKFLDDKDPAVRLEVLQHRSMVVNTAARAIALLDDPDASVRRQAGRILFGSWRKLGHADEVRDLEVALPKLDPTGFLGEIPGLSLRDWLCRNPSPLPKNHRGRQLALDCMSRLKIDASWPGFSGPLPQNAYEKELLATARAFGRRAASVGGVLTSCLPSWTRSALPSALELVKLGQGHEEPLARWIAKVGTRDDVPAVAAARFAGDFHNAQPTLEDWVSRVGTPADALGTLIQMADPWFREHGDNLKFSRVQFVVHAIVASDSEEAAEYLARAAHQWPELTKMLSPSWRHPSPGLRRVLRRLLVEPGAELAKARNYAFSGLIYHVRDPGDAGAFVKAYELGLESSGGGSDFYGLRIPTGRGLSGLREQFGDEHAPIVSACLAGGPRAAFEDFCMAKRGPKLVAAALPHLLRAPAVPLPGHTGHNLRSALFEETLRNFASAPEVLRVAKPTFIQALAHEDVRLRQVVLDRLPVAFLSDPRVQRALVQQFADVDLGYRRRALGFARRLPRSTPGLVAALEARLRDSSPEIVSLAAWLLQSRAPKVLEKHIDDLLTHSSGDVRERAAHFWVETHGPEGFAKVAALLANHHHKNVETLVDKVGSYMDLRAVPYLLQALKNPFAAKHAEQALKSIRFYHEEKSRWDRLMAGSGFQTGSAAEALIQQFHRTKQPAVKLAAVASLGTLADPESLPFLVKLMDDPDAALAAAARDAAAKINTRTAAAGKPENRSPGAGEQGKKRP